MVDEVEGTEEEQLDKSEQEVIEQEDTQEEEGNDGDVVVTIGDDPIPDEVEEERKAPEWVKELRKNDREKTRKIRELEEQLKQRTEVQPSLKLGEKPTLESCEYDPDKYESSLAKWFEDKRKVDEEAKKIEETTKQSQKAWDDRLKFYEDKKADLKVRDFDEAEFAVKEKLSVVQQGIMIKGAENPALVVYALKMNPKKLAQLAAIQDPIEYAFAVAKLEKDLKVTRKEAPPPERKVTGTGSLSGTNDSKLDRLREEASKTGDYSKVMAYKRNLKKA